MLSVGKAEKHVTIAEVSPEQAVWAYQQHRANHYVFLKHIQADFRKC